MEAYSKEFRRDVLRECDLGKGTRRISFLIAILSISEHQLTLVDVMLTEPFDWISIQD